VAQGVGPEFKLQYCKKTQKNKNPAVTWSCASGLRAMSLFLYPWISQWVVLSPGSGIGARQSSLNWVGT
jgi:hypothetical protein